MPTPYKANWDEIELSYIQGVTIEDNFSTPVHKFPTYAELADIYKLHPATVGSYAAKHDWTTKREMYALKVKELKKDTGLANIFNKSAQFDYMHVQALLDIQKLIRAYLNPYLELLDPETKQLLNEDGTPVRISMKELRDCVATIDASHRTVRSIYGEPIQGDALQKELDNLKERKINEEHLNMQIRVKMRELEKDEEYRLKQKKLAELRKLAEETVKNEDIS